MLTARLLKTLTFSIQQLLKADAQSAKRLQRLNGKNLEITLKPFDFTFYLRIQDNDFMLSDCAPEIIHATITGTPLQFAGVALFKADRNRFFAEDIQLSGDADAAHQIMKLFDELRIDWEDISSNIIGDIPAYRVSQFVKSTKNWLKTTCETLTHHIDDYVHEEANLAPSFFAVDDFLNDVDALRMQTDRLEAKMNHLIKEQTHDELV